MITALSILKVNYEYCLTIYGAASVRTSNVGVLSDKCNDEDGDCARVLTITIL